MFGSTPARVSLFPPTPALFVCVLALTFTAPGDAAAQFFRFNFNPPDDAVFHRLLVETSQFKTSRGPYALNEVSTERYALRRVGDGYECDFQLNAYEASIDGKPAHGLDSPMVFWAGLDLPVTLTLHESGIPLDVAGNDAVRDAILERGRRELGLASLEVPAAEQLLAGQIGMSMDSEILTGGFSEMMGLPAAILHGSHLSIGQTVPLQGGMMDSSGDLHILRGEMRAERVVDVGGKRCVEVLIALDPSPGLMVVFAREYEEKLALHGLFFGQIESMALKLLGRYTVDPATLMPQSQTLHSEVRMWVREEDGERVHIQGSIKKEGRFF
jgi:hypothetical protein